MIIKIKKKASGIIRGMIVQSGTNPGNFLPKVIVLYWLFRKHGKISVTASGRIYIPHKSENILYTIPIAFNS